MKLSLLLILAAVVAAIPVGLFAVHRGSVPTNLSAPVETDNVLQRRIASVHIHGVPTEDAMPQLAELIGMKIVPQIDALKKRHAYLDAEIWLDFDDVPLGELMSAFIEQIRGWGDAAGFDVRNGVIVIAPDENLKRTVRVYDVPDLLSQKSANLLPPRDDMSLALRFGLEERYWACGAVVNRESRWLHQDSSRLMVVQTSESHVKIGEYLKAIRAAQPDGSGPCIARSRVSRNRSYHTLVRFYDVRDFCGRAESVDRTYSPPLNSTGVKAVASLVSHILCEQPQPAFGGQACGAMGRLIVEQTPDVHAQVRQMLVDLRAGKKFDGFELMATDAAGHRP